MDAPPDPLDISLTEDGKTYSDIAHLARDCTPFVAIGTYLRQCGLRAPEIFAFDVARGLILLEDIGDTGFKPLLEGQDPGGDIARTLYSAAIEVLADFHRHEVPSVLPVAGAAPYALPAYEPSAMTIEVGLLLDWYAPSLLGRDIAQDQREKFSDIWAALLQECHPDAPVLVMRDYHSPNLHWFEAEKGIARIGVIDFQDGLAGHPAYDVASLLQDARRDVPPQLRSDLLNHYMDLRPSLDRAEFERAYAIIGTQRLTKILGIFARLWKRDGKSDYLVHIPRLWSYLEASLEHPSLKEYKAWIDQNIPPKDRKTGVPQ
jgi:aminoglycoside/choline kinase family phosphotransferase